MGPFWTKQRNVQSPFHFLPLLTPLQQDTDILTQSSTPSSFPSAMHTMVCTVLHSRSLTIHTSGKPFLPIPSPLDLVLVPSFLSESPRQSLAQMLLHLGYQAKSRHFHCLTLPSKPPTFLPDHPEFVFHDQKEP